MRGAEFDDEASEDVDGVAIGIGSSVAKIEVGRRKHLRMLYLIGFIRYRLGE